MVRCMVLLILSSILAMVRFTVFSISRRMVIFVTAKGMRTVCMQVFIKWMMVIAKWRFGK